MNRRAAALAFAYFLAILYLSLYPWHFTAAPHASGFTWTFTGTGRRAILDTVLNLGFYVPLGAAIVFAVKRERAAFLTAAAVCFLTSFGIEWIQRYVPGRFSSYVDLTTNTVGGVAGAAAAMYWRLEYASGWSPQRLKSWRISPTGALLAGLWIVSQTFPFLPSLSLLKAEANLRELFSPTIAPTEIGLGFVGLFVLGAAVDGWVWLTLGFLVVPIQAQIIQHRMSVGLIIGAALGLTAARAFTKRPSSQVTAMIVTVWLMLEEFRPFHFGERHQFYWLPFEGLMTGAPDTYGTVFFTKLFTYTAVIWALRRGSASWAAAVTLPAVILTAGELTQQYLPGRTPESTDLVVLIVGAVLLRIAEAARATRR